jgi:carboxynorspermidine decarboxylase
MNPIDFTKVPSPCYVVDERAIQGNLRRIHTIRKATGCKVLLALKGFSMYAVFGLIGKYLDGVTASSLHEARLGFEEMGKEVHCYAPAFIETDFQEILRYSDHLVFNSFSQWSKYRDIVSEYRSIHNKKIECGIRVNPEYSEIQTALYNPCAPYSRLGVTLDQFDWENFEGLSGLHFHSLCEQNADTLGRTIPVIEEKFQKALNRIKWLNLGGGHHITRSDYDVNTLIRLIMSVKEKYGIQVYLEPGEAIALHAGYLVCTVMDVVHNGMDLAVLDTSAACHMPDVTEMPYRPEVIGAGQPGEYPFSYRLGGMTCLAGDVIGDYSFKKPLASGDRLVFCDMAHYTMVKNNTFNGINLPSIAIFSDDHGIRLHKTFGYNDYKRRL